MIKATLTFRTMDEDGLGITTQTFFITDAQPLKVDPRLKVAGMEIELIAIEGGGDD